MNIYSFFLILILLFSGCSVKYDNNILKETLYHKNRIADFSNEIILLSSKINEDEARDVAFLSIKYSRELANKYKIITPPSLHNLFVNMDIKNKGLCYHFANDLMAHLEKQKYKTFKFIRIVSNKGKYNEHGSVLLTRDDIKFENSLVLDAWRNSGELFFIQVKKDKEYIWEKK